MGDVHDFEPPPEPVDELVKQLLSCGAVLSQMISGMVEFEASGRSAPDAAPIPEVAHSLIRDVLGEVRKRHSKRDIRVAATIVSEAEDAICENIFVVGPELIDESLAEDPPGAGSDVSHAPLNRMRLAEPLDQVGAFTLELLRGGLMLSGLAADTADDLSPDAYPGEDRHAVVVEMIAGSIHTVLADVDERDVRRATELITTALDRVVEHLRLALELSRRMHGEGEDGAGRAYG